MSYDETSRADLLQDLEADYTEFFLGVQSQINRLAKTKPVDQYVILQKIGDGTFGEVFRVRDKSTKQDFALKRIKMEQEREGFPKTALREIRILMTLNHENIVCLKEICHNSPTSRSGFIPEFFLLFELCDHDLAELIRLVDFTEAVKKTIMKQMLTGLYYLHVNNVLHRDLKAGNILVNSNGVLKIADFGLARTTMAAIRAERPTCYSGCVVTLWYRPPEILLNDRYYGKPVDLWSTGCVMAELWTKYPIMQGVNELHQLIQIIHLCGSITVDVWPDVQHLKAFAETHLAEGIKRQVREKLTAWIPSESAIDLIDQLLVLDPSKRLNVEQALSHDYFYEDPPPGDLRSCLMSFSNAGTSRNRLGEEMQRPGQPPPPSRLANVSRASKRKGSPTADLDPYLRDIIY